MVSITDVRSLLLLQLGSKEQSKENNWELFCNKVQKNDKFWSETFHRALVTYHKLSDVYNEIGCTIPSVGELAVSTATPFPEFTIYLAAGASKASSTLRAKSRLISQTVVHLLSQETTAEISLPLRSLLDLIGRLLSIPLSHARAKSAVDIGALVDVAPYLHIDAFSILEAVILSLGKTLATEASFINQLFVHLLCSTDKDTDGKLLKVRQKGLHVLSKWSIIMDTFAGFSPKDLETIVMGLIPNIKPKPKVVKLLAATAANKHKKGHKGRAHLILGDMQDATNSVTDDDVELAVAALTVFHAIFSCSYVYVNARLYIHAVQNIMEELMTVYRRKDNVSGLHEHSRVRLSLLKVLKALLLIPAFRFSRSVPIEPSLVLFADAVNSEPNLEIKLFLLESLNSISLLLHHAETDSHMSEDAVKQVAEAEVVEPEDLSTAETVDSSVSTEQGDVSLPKKLKDSVVRESTVETSASITITEEIPTPDTEGPEIETCEGNQVALPKENGAEEPIEGETTLDSTPEDDTLVSADLSVDFTRGSSLGDAESVEKSVDKETESIKQVTKSVDKDNICVTPENGSVDHDSPNAQKGNKRVSHSSKMIPMTPTRRSARIRGRHGGGSDISETNSDYALRVSQADATKDTDSVLKKSREPDIEEIEISSDSNNENDETVLRSKKRKRESVIPSEVKRTKETGKGKKLSDPFEDENNPDLMDMLQDFVE